MNDIPEKPDYFRWTCSLIFRFKLGRKFC